MAAQGMRDFCEVFKLPKDKQREKKFTGFRICAAARQLRCKYGKVTYTWAKLIYKWSQRLRPYPIR